jgi:hypothetical protein
MKKLIVGILLSLVALYAYFTNQSYNIQIEADFHLLIASAILIGMGIGDVVKAYEDDEPTT